MRVWRWCLWLCGVLLLVCAGGAGWAQAQDAGLQSMEMTGTVGPYPVGLNYTVRDNTQLVAAHYFYVSEGKNIALTGVAKDGGVEWKGADGSMFHLRFVGPADKSGKPLTFYTSTGLKGTWELGGKTLPVDLSGGYSTANPGQRFYADVTGEPDAVFEGKVAAFRKAVLAGDRAAAMQFMDFPVQVNRAKSRVRVRNAAEMNAQWTQIFTPRMLAKLKGDVAHEMFVRNGMAMLGDGELWFDGKGLTSVNVF